MRSRTPTKRSQSPAASKTPSKSEVKSDVLSAVDAKVARTSSKKKVAAAGFDSAAAAPSRSEELAVFVCLLSCISWASYEHAFATAGFLHQSVRDTLNIVALASILWMTAQRVNTRLTDFTAYGSLIVLFVTLSVASWVTAAFPAEYMKTASYVGCVASTGFLAWAYLPLNFREKENWILTAAVAATMLTIEFSRGALSTEATFSFDGGLAYLSKTYVPTNGLNVEANHSQLVSILMFLTCAVQLPRAIGSLQEKSADRWQALSAAVGLLFLSPQLLSALPATGAVLSKDIWEHVFSWAGFYFLSVST